MKRVVRVIVWIVGLWAVGWCAFAAIAFAFAPNAGLAIVCGVLAVVVLFLWRSLDRGLRD